MDRCRIVLCCCFMVMLSALMPAGIRAQTRFRASEAVDQAVLAEMQRQQIVGVAVGVIQDAKIVYTKGYGFANLRSQTETTDETVFNWASNSKPVMAIAAMQLVQQGRLDIDKPIGGYIPELPEHLQGITCRQLLCHQSGIPHYSNGRVVPWGRRARSQEELDPFNGLRRFAMSPLIFPPGAKTAYSSYAYVLLSAVVQAAGDEPIDKQLDARIVAPIGLKSFQLDLAAPQREWTTGYRVVDGRPLEVDDEAHFWKHGAGGYKSNVRDFARFAVAVATEELIDAKTTSLMWTLQKTSDGQASGYGLGVAVSGAGRSLKVSHNGSQDETKTRMVVYPNQKHGVVVMCNTQDADPGRISTAVYTAINGR